MDLQQSLRALGFYWDGTTLQDAIQRFQFAYCGPPTGANRDGWLATDGIAGPKTNDSLAWTLANGGRLSTNFAASETWCKHCKKNFVRRELLSALEELRKATGPLPLLSVCRCPQHNKDIGGASNSQHQFGSGCDPGILPSVSVVERVGRFSGIGSRNGFKTACHIDVRHIWGEDKRMNETKSSIGAPAKFVE